MALNYDSPLIDNTAGSPTLDSLKSGSDKINGALTEIKEEVNDLGSASLVDTGTAAGEVPTNADLGSASTADVQTSATDDTADRLMAVGAFGLGLPNIIPTGVDLNDYVTQGFYNINNVTGISNLPPGGVGSLVVLNYAAPPTVRTTQNFYSVDGSIYSRSGVATTWTDWVELYHTGNTGTAATKDTGTLDTEVPLNSSLVPKSGGTFTGDIEAPKITASTGILFGTDTAAANTLDDYEEGTWTPASTELGTLTILKANYTKIGDTVRLFAQVTASSTTTVTLDNAVSISGIPISVDSGNTLGVGGSIQYYANHGNNKNALGDLITLGDNFDSEIIVVRGTFTYADCASITISLTYKAA